MNATGILDRKLIGELAALIGAAELERAQRRAATRCGCCKRRRATDPRKADWCRGYCKACYARWRYRRFPAGGPQPPAHRAGGARDGRLEDYGELRGWGVPVSEAAVRVGVSVRTAQRYEAVLNVPVAEAS